MIKNTYCLELIFIYWILFSSRNWWKRSYWRRSYFWRKKTKDIRKKLNCTFIRINTSKENYDVDYEASKIQTFISNFKDKEKENEIKKLEDEINKLKLQLTNLNVKNNDDNVNDNDKIIIIIIIQSHYKKCIFIAKIVINIQVTYFQKN